MKLDDKYMSLSVRPYKGTRDFYPEDVQKHEFMFSVLRKVAKSYHFCEYMGPQLESFDLYAAKTGEEIVEKQLYTFEDRGGRRIAIRPEMTPTMARMVAAKFQELPKPIRWMSVPNVWRYERPQRGRLREHWQFNLDLLGGDQFFADLEVLKIAYDCLASFGAASESFEIKFNHRQLVNSFFKDFLKLDASLSLQVTKVIDAVDKVSAEKFNDSLTELSLSASQIDSVHKFINSPLEDLKAMVCPIAFEYTLKLQEKLSQFGSSFVFSSKIMRGLDYYTGLVFEAFDCMPENNRALFGGGRYDNLIDLFGKDSLSGVGFGLGDVTLENFLQTRELLSPSENCVDLYVSSMSEDLLENSFFLSHELRKKGFSVAHSLKFEKMKGVLKNSLKNNARFFVVFAEEEWKNGKIVLKNLQTQEQKVIDVKELVANAKELLA